MIINIWGSRGSIPVSGKNYIKYGGDTTCIEITTKNNVTIIIDAGTGIRKLGNKLIEENKHRFHMIFTHAHWDHLLGFPSFKPIYRKNTTIDMYGCPFAWDSIKDLIANTMTHPYFPIEYDEISAKISYSKLCKNEIQIDSLSIIPIFLSHPNNGIGFKFIEDNKTFVFLTDNELSFLHAGGLEFEDYRKFCQGADFLIHDAEFTEDEYVGTRTWGHSIYTDALRLAVESGVKEFALFHHNQDRTDKEIDKIVDHCKEVIAKEKSSMKCFAAASGMEITL